VIEGLYIRRVQA